MLKIIKNLDKENTNLKNTAKIYTDNLSTLKVYLKSFEKNRRDLLDKIKILEFKNNTILNENKKSKTYDETDNLLDEQTMDDYSVENWSTVDTITSDG